VNGGYLLDTSVLSALAPGEPPIPEKVADWLRTRTDRVFLPAIAIAEIEQGICKLRRARGTIRAEQFSIWLDNLISNYGDRILALDWKVGRTAGALSDAATVAGNNPGFPDLAIAATTAVHRLLLLTRNGRHFGQMGIDHADPFEALP
jgi:predicted nucleic acid-binding protein